MHVSQGLVDCTKQPIQSTDQQRVAPLSFIHFPGPSLDGEASAHGTTALCLPYHQTCGDTCGMVQMK